MVTTSCTLSVLPPAEVRASSTNLSGTIEMAERELTGAMYGVQRKKYSSSLHYPGSQ